MPPAKRLLAFFYIAPRLRGWGCAFRFLFPGIKQFKAVNWTAVIGDLPTAMTERRALTLTQATKPRSAGKTCSYPNPGRKSLKKTPAPALSPAAAACHPESRLSPLLIPLQPTVRPSWALSNRLGTRPVLAESPRLSLEPRPNPGPCRSSGP